MTEIRIQCYCCKRVFPSTGINGTELVSCPYCGHEVYVPVARES
jgi:rRNA maturation endonuclease Nob1